MQVDELAHKIEARRDRLASLHQNLKQLPLSSQKLLEEICCELRTALEELQVAQSALHQPNKELVFNVEERLDINDGKQALATLGESEERFRSLVSTIPDPIYRCACNREQDSTAQLRNAFEQLHSDIAERKRIEEELEQSLSLLRGSLEATADGIIVSQNARTIAAFNQKLVEMWGIPESVIALRDLNCVVPLLLEQLKDPEAFLCATQELLSQPDAEGHDTLELKDGRIFERYSLPQRIGGNIVGRVCSFRDITERFSTQAALRESEERYRAVVEQTLDGIYLVDARTLRILEANAAFCNSLGYTCEELLELTIYDIVAIDREILEANIQRALLEKRVFVSEGRHRRKDGSLVNVEVSVSLISYSGREVFSTVVRDITERKQMEEALRKSEATNRALLNAIPDLMIRMTRDGTYLDFIPAKNFKIVMPTREMRGKNLYEVMPPDIAQQRMHYVEQALSTCETQIYEYQLEWDDGNVSYQEARIVVSGEDEVLVIVRDITDRFSTELALAESQRRLASLINSLPGIAFSCSNDLQWSMRYLSEGCLNLTGYKSEELLENGRVSYSSITHPEDLPKVLSAINVAVAKKQPYVVEYRIRTKLGQEKWLWEKGSGVFDSNGEVLGLEGFITDISDRKQTEKVLQQKEEFLQLILDNIPQFIFWKDRNSVYLGCNRNFAIVAGLSTPENVVGKTDYDMAWKKEESDFFRSCDARVIETETPEYHIIEPQLQANGKQAWLDTNKIPLHDAEGQVVGILGSYEDITERKLAEEALKKAKEELEIRVEERTALLRQAITSLSFTNRQLHSEIEERKLAEEELQQSEARFREVANREALLNRLASQIRNSLNLDTILETAVQEIYNQLEIDACLFAWYATDNSPSAWEVVKEVKNLDLPSFVGLYPLESWGPFTCKIVNQEVFQVDNVTECDCAVQQMLLPFGTAALLSLPIVTQSGELGAITCGRLVSSQSWADEELELLQAVANQLVIGINQAQLYSQSRIAAITAQTKATQLEVAMRELQHTQAQLVQSEKMSSLGQLVAGVAHEINNPLNFIHGNLIHAHQYTEDLLNLIQLYQESYPHPSPEIKAETEAIDLDFIKADFPKILKSMQMGADRICQIVLSLRNFSRAEQAEMKQVDIHEGLDNTLLILDHRLKAKANHPAICVIKEYGNLPSVQGYAGQLNQVFMNILTNAIDALDEYNKERSPEDIQNKPSTIQIRTEVNNSNQVLIQIIDNGPGMTQEVCRRLFDPFFTTKPVGHGTGLGMSISYQIVVERHGGQLQCISAPGQGAEFLIYLPIGRPSS